MKSAIDFCSRSDYFVQYLRDLEDLLKLPGYSLAVDILVGVFSSEGLLFGCCNCCIRRAPHKQDSFFE